jgi:hypothetical protein
MDRGYGRGSSFSQVLRPFTTSFPGRITTNQSIRAHFYLHTVLQVLIPSRRCFVNEIPSTLSEVGILEGILRAARVLTTLAGAQKA